MMPINEPESPLETRESQKEGIEQGNGLESDSGLLRETEGTRMSAKTRSQTNHLTPSERADLLSAALSLIYSPNINLENK